MIANDQVDLDELIRTCDCLMKYFAKSGISERRPIEIFQAIFEKSMLLIEDEATAHLLVFDAEEICNQAKYIKNDYSEAKEFIVRNRKSFDKLIQDNIEEITHFCTLSDVKYLPIIKNTDSKGGHKTYFYIGLVQISKTIKHELKLNSKIKQDDVLIEYIVPQLPKAPTWAKPLLNFKISGWKFYTYISLPILALFLGYILFLWNYFSMSTVSLFYTIIISAVFGFSYCLLKPFYEAIQKRIGIAPIWLTKLKVISAQLRYVRTESKRSNGKFIRALQLVVYQAECPICNSEVFIEKGKNAHKGRLIGVCDESPREHIFSFDHVMKKGKLII